MTDDEEQTTGPRVTPATEVREHRRRRAQARPGNRNARDRRDAEQQPRRRYPGLFAEDRARARHLAESSDLQRAGFRIDLQQTVTLGAVAITSARRGSGAHVVRNTRTGEDYYVDDVAEAYRVAGEQHRANLAATPAREEPVDPFRARRAGIPTPPPGLAGDLSTHLAETLDD